MMKKICLLLVLLLIFCSLPFGASAKNYFEECRFCKMSGEFHCPSCNNEVILKCDLDSCGGMGYWTCEECAGEGKTVCPSCHGDGLIRTGDGEIPIDAQPGSCGNCGGSGYFECNFCHGSGKHYCERCGGDGEVECQNGECQLARKVSFKCPHCIGTGYLHHPIPGDPTPEKNDGVFNIPKAGDEITRLDGTIYTLGGSQQPAETKNGDPDPADQTEPQQDGTQPETDETAPETQEDTYEDMTTEAPITAEPLPEHIEYERSQIDFRIDGGNAEIPEAEKQQTAKIVESCEPGRMDGKTQQIIESSSKISGDQFPENRIYPIYFEGHIKLENPVRVTVKIEDNTLAGGSDLYIYHICEDGNVEFLPDADLTYYTYESGYVQAISFNTKEFSTFFTSSLRFDPADAPDDDTKQYGITTEPDGETDEENKDGHSTLITVIIIISAVLAVGIVLIIALKKKGKK